MGPEHPSIYQIEETRKKIDWPVSHCFDDVLAEGQVEPSRVFSSWVELIKNLDKKKKKTGFL